MSEQRPWLSHEDARLKRAIHGRVGLYTLARQLGRSTRALEARAQRLGLRAPVADEWAALHAKLAWQHGPERARDIFDGKDPDTNADLAAWRKLGASA